MHRFTWALVLVFLIAMAWRERHGTIDYPMYERAANRVLVGDLANLYEPGRVEPPKFHYSYFFAWTLGPYAAISPWGTWLWYLTFAIAFAYLVLESFRWARELGPPIEPQWRLPYEIGFVLILAYPASDAFITGNIGLLLAALMMVSLRFAIDKPALSAAALGVAIAFKFYPAFLLGFYVWAHRWKVLALSVGFTLLFYAGIPIAVEGPSVALSLIQTQFTALTAFGDHWPMDSLYFQNIPAAIMRGFGKVGVPWQETYRLSVLVALAIPIALFLPTFFRQKTAHQERLMGILTLALVPLVVPMGWVNMGVFYGPMIALVLRSAVAGNDFGARVAFGVFVALYSLTTRDLIGRSLNDRLESFSVPVFGVLALVSWLYLSAHPVSRQKSASSMG